MNSNYFIPVAIVVAGGLIASSLFLRDAAPGDVIAAGGHGGGGMGGPNVALAAEREEGGHIMGSEDAVIKVVEFSDFECPFCGRLHPTLERLVEESDGKISWEYRHLPLPSHRNAEEAAYSAECIARLGADGSFWEFADNAFANQRGLNTVFFEAEATRLGINIDEFRTCVASDEIAAIVEADQNTAVSHGGSGTPFSVVVFPDGTTQPISGALPYENWAQLLTLANATATEN